ncbi:hypothetical protein RHMOL_Rhmol06G0198600 [Rhododendron molle]|uniref:Uncharacterized protein n=1 Tax=Rhododendron molle TaxID=49168 RepID=A0ACC0NEE5_RHOML|nr:hypothetical protein RHMOL_Rhmol06G0198600 [Rhododendron molle]
MGTGDYICRHTRDVVPVRVLDTLPIGILRQMGGLLSKAYSGPVRVLHTLPIDILRQMGGLLSKEVDHFSDIDNLLQKDGFRGVYQGQKIDSIQEVHNLGKETEVDLWKFAIQFVLGANFDFILFRPVSLEVYWLEIFIRSSTQSGEISSWAGIARSSLSRLFDLLLSLVWVVKSAMYQFLASAKLDLQLQDKRNISGAICPLEYQPSQHQDKYAARLYS